MNLYLLSQSVNTNYDTYDSAVVAAESEEDAVKIHPGADFYQDDDWQTTKSHAWAPLASITVTCIGVAAEGVEKGVVLASFNAG